MAVTQKTYELDKDAKLDYQSLLKYWLGDDTLSSVSLNGDSASEIDATAVQKNASEITVDGEAQPADTVVSLWAEPKAGAIVGNVYRVIVDFVTTQGREEQCYFDFKIVE